MERFSVMGKGMLVVAAMACGVLAMPRPAIAQAAQPDPFKFTTSAPVLFINYIKADKTADFEEGWAKVRALIAKTDNAELKALGESLAKLSKVDIAPIDLGGGKAVIYIFQLDAPSTTLTYNPRTILYEYLKPGAEGSGVTRADVDPVYDKIKDDYLQIAVWPLVKVVK